MSNMLHVSAQQSDTVRGILVYEKKQVN